MDRASLEQDRLIERVWNWTSGSSESGTGDVNRLSLELDWWNWRGESSESGTGQVDRVSLR